MMLGNCPECGGLVVIERLSVRPRRCIHCSFGGKRA